MALALIRAHALTGTQKYLDRATSLYADIKAAWNTTCCGPTPGGLWWDRPHTQKATAANAGAVITAMRLGDVAFASQLAGTVLGVVIAAAGAAIIYGVLKKTVGLSLQAEQEFVGADLTIHKISATPEREQSW